MSDGGLNNETEVPLTDQDIAAVEAALADFDLPEDDVVEEVEAHLERIETYESMPASGADILDAPEVVEREVEAPAPAKEKKARKAKEPKAPKAPSVERDLSKIDATFFQLREGKPSERDEVIALRPVQKKIAEKFDNLFQSFAAGKKPSVFTLEAFRVLNDKGIVTQADLVTAFKAGEDGYNDGTARSQAGQMMVLFSVLDVATRVGQTLSLIPDSSIAARLRSFL
jgi:hypothetical protein